ncbi:MAG: hypoxanthine phosphoribosyltransferase [Nitrospirota bacterium]|nr:hypoxanthine phosphoribosyltransferase [Nitrospirota bacterium]
MNRRKAVTERKFGKALIDAKTLSDRIRQLALQISRDYEGREILAIGVLKGAAMFYTDLVRHIQVPVVMDFIQVKSYAGRTATSGEVRTIAQPEFIDDMQGRHVMIIEDIVDSGVTMRYLQKMLLTKNPASLSACTLLDKPSRRRMEVPVNYIGFTIPDLFVVGYGLDYNERYRNLPYIASLDNPEGEGSHPSSG